MEHCIPGEDPKSRESWQPTVLDPSVAVDRDRMEHLLRSNRVWQVHDMIDQQLDDLAKVRRLWGKEHPSHLTLTSGQAVDSQALLDTYGRWIYYPWSGRLVHVLPPEEFRELRLDRNQHKITFAEQAHVTDFVVGIVGLSAGNAVALSLALDEVCGFLKLADFDCLELSNMNRIRAGIQDIGVSKAMLTARQIFELNPYANLQLFPQGLSPENLEEFLLGDPKLNVVVDECDDLRMKVLLRERARSLHLPVLMQTSDRGLTDIERFDLEPDRPLFHGLLGDITGTDIPPDLSNEDKVKFALPIVGAETISTRLAASLLEVQQTIATWPQLGSDVTLGGSIIATAVRRLALGHCLPSGRHYIDVDSILANLPVTDLPADEGVAGSKEKSGAALSHAGQQHEDLPELIRFVVEHGILAPSGGNSQPWKFYYDGTGLWVNHDKQRSRNLFDGRHRGAYIALGAAIENMVIAAAHLGYQTNIERFPSPDDLSGPTEESVAFLSFIESSSVDAERMKLFPLLKQRVTNRRQSIRETLNPGHSSLLQSIAMQRGACLHFLTDESDLAEIADILGEGDRLRFLCADLHQEAMSEMRWTPEEAETTCDGIDIASLELSEGQAIGMKLVARPDVARLLRNLDAGGGLARSAHKAIQSASAVGLLSVHGQNRRDALLGGQTIEHLWLKAHQLGLSWHPMTALLFIFEMLQTDEADIFRPSELENLRTLQERFGRLFPASHQQTPLMLFRLSQAAPPTVRSLRRPVDGMLSIGQPTGRRP